MFDRYESGITSTYFPKSKNYFFKICEGFGGRLWVILWKELNVWQQDDLQWRLPGYHWWTVHDPSPAAFVPVWHEAGMRLFCLCAGKMSWRELSTPIFAPTRGPLMADTSTAAVWNHWERCVGLWEGDLLLLPSLVCWRELWVVLLSTQLVMLSLLTAGARLYKPPPMRHVLMLHESSILCMHTVCLLSTPKCTLKSILN